MSSHLRLCPLICPPWKPEGYSFSLLTRLGACNPSFCLKHCGDFPQLQDGPSSSRDFRGLPLPPWPLGLLHTAPRRTSTGPQTGRSPASMWPLDCNPLCLERPHSLDQTLSSPSPRPVCGTRDRSSPTGNPADSWDAGTCARSRSLFQNMGMDGESDRAEGESSERVSSACCGPICQAR